MRVAKHLFLVRINTALQDRKRSMSPGGILFHPEFVFMERNLQFGTIVQIGEVAHRNYPEAQVGDEIYFHHTVEDEDDRVLHVEENGDKLIAVYAGEINQNYEVYGTASRERGLIPSRHYVWLSADVKRITMGRGLTKEKMETANMESTLVTDFQMGDDWDSPERLRGRIEELGLDIDSLKKSIGGRQPHENQQQAYDRNEMIINTINKIQKEQGLMTQLISKKRLGFGSVFAISSMAQRDLPQMDNGTTIVTQLPLYPLEIFNADDPKNSAQFMIVRTNAVVGYWN